MKKSLILLLLPLIFASCSSSANDARIIELESQLAEAESIIADYSEFESDLTESESICPDCSELESKLAEAESIADDYAYRAVKAESALNNLPSQDEIEDYKKQIAELQAELSEALSASSSDSSSYYGQKALEVALDWLGRIPDSPSGVEIILKNEGFQAADINYVLTHPDIDWNVVATDLVNRFYSDLDRDSIIWMLEFEGFTEEQAIYAADNYTKTTASADKDHEPTLGEKNALKSAQQYLDFTAFSEKGLIDQLKYEGYSTSEAEYAVDNCGADWYEQAEKMAEQYLEFSSFSRQSLIEQLEYEGFTSSQAIHGAESVGY